MAKVVFTTIATAGRTRPASVTTKRVKAADGTTMTMHTIDADSATFGDGVSYVFRKNVEKARREQKQRGHAPAKA